MLPYLPDERRGCRVSHLYSETSLCVVSSISRIERGNALPFPLPAQIHKAARTEKGHLVRPTLGPPSNIRQSGTSAATLQLATSARRWQCAIRLAKCMIAFSVAAGLTIRQQWAEETSATWVKKMAHPRHHTRSNSSVFIMRRDRKLH
ncbi:uncharacterized protein BKA55DRAFT_583713 [Fusarium redolens]|uniref:Uncharacterized protein n=1 Tax=Fusarium redolens TaxID=48865 RepID=A0A9P9G1J2_FUSRE|nr:uncharacterized protein BKA55DRAFT_583713 [Fusarium redolens]KAH7228456.1 hypothetical protein BKA55DRAFT_583713 [Fusarium redolens]